MNAAVIPLCELFAVVDAVMTEDDAMKTVKAMRTGMGRIRRQWEMSRKELGGDPQVHE